MRRDLLDLARIIGAEDSEKRSNATGANERLTPLRHVRSGLGSHSGQLIELPDLFLECHQTKNRVGDL